jgi:transposase
MIIGIDVSKDKLDVFNSSNGKHYVILNTKASISSFFKNKLSVDEIKLVIFEATGGYEKRLLCYVLQQDIAYHKAHPLRAHRFAQCKGSFAKTDKIDAKMLALYGSGKDIVPDEKVSMIQLKIKEYSSRRNQLKGIITAETQRLKVVNIDKQITNSIKRSIKLNSRELELISNKLKEIIQSCAALKNKYELLQSAKGIGPEVASILVTDFSELGKLSREQISHLLGVAPQTKDSGKKRGYRSISQGRFYVRKALYMSALVASRFDPRMKKFYEKLLAKGKAKKVALVAVMRKIIIMLNAMVKYNTPWQSERI